MGCIAVVCPHATGTYYAFVRWTRYVITHYSYYSISFNESWLRTDLSNLVLKIRSGHDLHITIKYIVLRIIIGGKPQKWTFTRRKRVKFVFLNSTVLRKQKSRCTIALFIILMSRYFAFEDYNVVLLLVKFNFERWWLLFELLLYMLKTCICASLIVFINNLDFYFL